MTHCAGGPVLILYIPHTQGVLRSGAGAPEIVASGAFQGGAQAFQSFAFLVFLRFILRASAVA